MPDGDDPVQITVDDIDRAPETAAVTHSDTLVTSEALRDAFVRLSEENATLKEDLEVTRKRVRTIEILDDLIEPMAKRSFGFMCAYCGAVGALVTLHGFKLWSFSLPESVLQFLVGSTAATVIGLVGMVLTGIFVGARPKRD